MAYGDTQVPFLILLYVLFVLAIAGGWIANLFWLFANLTYTPEFWLALAGVFAFPLGALHGIYVWFL